MDATTRGKVRAQVAACDLRIDNERMSPPEAVPPGRKARLLSRNRHFTHGPDCKP
jgi:hypothetical protein